MITVEPLNRLLSAGPEQADKGGYDLIHGLHLLHQHTIDAVFVSTGWDTKSSAACELPTPATGVDPGCTVPGVPVPMTGTFSSGP